MSPRAAELWLDELTDTAEVDREVIHAALTLELDIDSRVTITRTHANADRVQGLAIDADHSFTIGDHDASRMVLWSDAAPEQVEVIVPAGRLTIWNVWREAGAVQAWIGAAGIRRIELDNPACDFGVRLLAFDGHKGSTPDLEVDICINAANAVGTTDE
ncbi:MAG: hypothetical protein AAGC53_05800 [Actinomycetota bacterium]